MASSTVFVYTMNQAGKRGAWSTYVFPFVINDHAHVGNNLYLRAGDAVYLVDPDLYVDQVDEDTALPIESKLRWPFLDCGSPGSEKNLEGIDVVGEGECTVQIGANQRAATEMTAPYSAPADTLPGSIIPIPISGPSFSLQINFTTADNPNGWEWLASNLYLQDGTY
jgi:hypothetical protein